MSMTSRKSISTDAPQFITIKDSLPMATGGDATSRGGFLLGTDLSTYQRYIENAYCQSLALEDGSLAGFGIIVPDAFVKRGELWTKRNSAHWEIDLATIESKKLCYFEQLAFRLGYGRYAPELCYRLIERAFTDGHELLLTTTVQRPVTNLAAIPFIEAVGGWQVGTIEEEYPAVGRIDSAIWLIEAKGFYEKVQELLFYQRMNVIDR